MEWRAFLAGAAAAGIAWLLPRFWPGLTENVLARGAAWLASLFTCSPLVHGARGWELPGGAVPVVVTNACSATDYYGVVAALAGWRLARRGWGVVSAVAVAGTFALPVTVFVNALRIVAVAQAHRWGNTLLPAWCDAALHLVVGVAVFLPSLLGLNFILEHHGRPHSLRCR